MSCENELKGEGFENLIKLCKENPRAGMIRHCDKVIGGEKDCIIFDCNLQRIDCENQVKPYEENTDTIIARDDKGVCDLYKSTGASDTDKGYTQYYDKKNPIQCPINGIPIYGFRQ